MRIENFSQAKERVDEMGFSVVSQEEKPWGGYFTIDDEDLDLFLSTFFGDSATGLTKSGLGLSPKILVVLPGKRLSWQYHDRRAELWPVFQGPVKIAESGTDEQPDPRVLNEGDTVNIPVGTRHRLIGSDGHGVLS